MPRRPLAPGLLLKAAMRSAALISVALVSLTIAGVSAGANELRWPAQSKVAQKRGRQVRKAREELVRANQLEQAALAGSSQTPASDLLRAGALRSRARARLRMLDALIEQGLSKSPREHLKEARRFEASARAVDGDPGAQALFRQKLADARGERSYWQRQGAYGSSSYTPPKKRVSRAKPRVRVRPVEYLMTASDTRGTRARARDRQAVNQAAQPSARTQMIRSRPLRFYGQVFGDVFVQLVSAMSRSETWIDVGAGTGAALAGYAQWRPEGATLVAVDLADDASNAANRLPPGRMRVVKGDVTRVRGLGKARLVTDVFAAMSYGDAPDRVIRRYGDLLEPGGQAMIFLEERRNVILSRDGRTSENLLDYLRRVEGFTFSDADVRVFDQGTAVLLRRTGGPVKAPRLELVEFNDGGPPRRVFRMPGARSLANPVESRFVPRVRR